MVKSDIYLEWNAATKDSNNLVIEWDVSSVKDHIFNNLVMMGFGLKSLILGWKEELVRLLSSDVGLLGCWSACGTLKYTR